MSEQVLEKRAPDSKSEVLSDRLFQAAPDAIVLTDARGEIVRVNAQAERMFGFSGSELLSQPVEILVPERFRPASPAEYDIGASWQIGLE